ncbi:MAG: hypothetical protein J6J27_03905 [Alphaproteobacteria bacterium]|nr:hypothetical protein [Alphaproteobacteria bacterium]
MNKKFLALALLLSLSLPVRAGYIESPSVYACGSCFIKLPENLSRKSYDYLLREGAVYDDAGNFVGLNKIKSAIENAGITDYEIKTYTENHQVFFNIITDDKNKNFLPLIIGGVYGVYPVEDNDVLLSHENEIYATTSYTTCRQKAYNNAMKDLHAHGVVDAEYNISLDDLKTGYYTDDTFQVQVCLEATENEYED